MEKTYFCKVEGMTCGNCALTISRFLEKKGMKHISANAASGELNFTTVQDTDVDRIYKGINELGYKVIKPGEEEDHAHQGHHHHGSPQLKRMLAICIIFTAPLLLHMFAGHNSILNNPWLQLTLCIPPYSIGLYHFGTSAYRSLKNGIPNMDVLIIMGATAAFVYSVTGMLLYTRDAHQYLFFETTATIITFVLAGNYIEERTSNATTSAIKALAQLQPSRARLVMTDSIGKESIMEIESKYLKLNDVVLVNDGDSIPVDGVVLSGTADVNESMITGESMPVTKEPGDTVTGGAVITAGNMRIRATAVGEATALSEIIRLVQKAQGAKPPMQKLADKISAVFVPAVLGIAILSFLVNYFIADVAFAQSMMRSIAVVVIACPCAMGLATPAAVAVGLGRAARNGILIKGGDTLEQFKDIRQIVFDKTGTLTTGKLAIKSFETSGISEQEFKAVVTGLEQFSAHPIAKSLLRQWPDATPLPLKDITETKGLGIRAADHEGNKWELGSYRLLEKGLHANPLLDLHLLKNGQWVGGISMQDELREDAVATIGTLHRDGFQTVLLSGDHQIKVEEVSGMLGMDKVMFQQTPAQKMEHLEQLIKAGPTLMVGDGINDAPALAKADIGVSLSDATKVAMQSAQVILSGNKLNSLSKAIKLGRFTYQTIRQNLFWAFFYNILAIPLAAMGYLSPIWAAAVMAFSDVILVLNSLRLNYRKID